jgi:hypothetical protein
MSVEVTGLGQEEVRAMKSGDVLMEVPMDPLTATQTEADRLAPELNDARTALATSSLKSAAAGEEGDRPTTTIGSSAAFPVDAFAAIRAEAGQRLARELQDVRMALVASYDQAMALLEKDRWVPIDLVTRLVDEIWAAVAAERERADALAKALEAAKAEADSIRTESQATIDAARETAARYECELNAARDEAKSAVAVAAQVQAELSAVRTRYQDILDSQMLQLVEFKREIEPATGKPEPASTAAVATAQSTGARLAKPGSPGPTVNARVEKGRDGGAATFSAIEAALAASPPLGRWPRAVG